MRLLTLLCGLLALPLAAQSPAAARQIFVEKAPLVDDSPFELFPFQATATTATRREEDEPLLLAQASDPRVVGLEEQVRQLTGRMEEMNFQMLQMQEQLRKMQEDVDFRLQEIEQRRGDAGSSAGKEPRSRAEAPEPRQTGQAGRDQQLADATPRAPGGAAAGPGEPPRQLGTMVFDESGKLKNGSIDTSTLDTSAIPQDGAIAQDGEPMHPDDQTVVAALPSSADPQELYRSSYEFVLSGDYGTAEAGFREYIERFPNDERSADAHYWLGESLLGQQRYRDAAELFVDANRRYPDSRKSPDMLFKLGVSLSALNQRDVACATFKKVGQRYPQASDALKQRVKQEQALSGC